MCYAPHQSPSGDSFPPKGKPYILPYLKATTIPRFKSEQYKKCEYGRREFTIVNDQDRTQHDKVMRSFSSACFL